MFNNLLVKVTGPQNERNHFITVARQSCKQRPSSWREIKKKKMRRRRRRRRRKRQFFPFCPYRRRPWKDDGHDHPGFLQPGSVPGVHGVSPIHVPRVEISLGVRKASLSHAVVLAHYQRVVVERGERSLVLLPPQMFGRLRTTHTPGSPAGD